MKTQIKIPYVAYFLSVFYLTFNYGQVSVSVDKDSGIYKVGETALWTFNLPDSSVDSLRFTLKKGGLTVVKEGALYPKGDKFTLSHRFNEPGALLVDVQWLDENKANQRLVGGAIASPEKLTLSASRPDDFDSFWENQISALGKITKNPKLKKEESGADGIRYHKITMDHVNGTKIRGQIARPKRGSKLPALLIVQWAGVYPLQKNWVIDKAKKGWLVLNINAHDLPIDEPKSFYEKQAMGPLKNYPSIGNSDRNTSYFRRMYLSCYRAAQYLTERKDWNGETLVVMGTSQGGLQSLITAGLHPRITASLALVPAGFDMHGPLVGRKGGWPQWYGTIEGKDAQKVRETSRYFDVANFIPRIECPVLVGIGLLDEVCPPEGIYAGLNQLNGQKEIVLLPNSGHQDSNNSQKPYTTRAENGWLATLVQGNLPVASE